MTKRWEMGTNSFCSRVLDWLGSAEPPFPLGETAAGNGHMPREQLGSDRQTKGPRGARFLRGAWVPARAPPAERAARGAGLSRPHPSPAPTLSLVHRLWVWESCIFP